MSLLCVSSSERSVLSSDLKGSAHERNSCVYIRAIEEG